MNICLHAHRLQGSEVGVDRYDVSIFLVEWVVLARTSSSDNYCWNPTRILGTLRTILQRMAWITNFIVVMDVNSKLLQTWFVDPARCVLVMVARCQSWCGSVCY